MSQKRDAQSSKESSPRPPSTVTGKIWHFLWYDDSIWSWIANFAIAFILIKFVVYPLLSLTLSTSLPVVAVVSGSMEHAFRPECMQSRMDGSCALFSDRITMCAATAASAGSVTLDAYLQTCGQWYEARNITPDHFRQFPFKNGFAAGDVMIIRGKKISQVEIGDVIIFYSNDGIPIIHRVVAIHNDGTAIYLQTKGDHNADSNDRYPRSEMRIDSQQYVGTAIAIVPYVGYVKLAAVRAVESIRSLFA